MSRPWFYVLSLLCAGSLALSLFVFFSPPAASSPSSGYSYVLKDHHGRLALFAPDEAQPVQVYEVYTRLLPEQDVLSLQAGIPLDSEAELQRLLEDFGL